MHELQALRDVFNADQVDGAREEARDFVAEHAAREGQVVDQDWRPSTWVLRLLREARRNRCAHWPREGSQLVFVLAIARALQCRRCASRTMRLLDGGQPRCDVCLELVPLTLFAFQAGATTVVTGRCCAGCLPTVTGQEAA